MTARPVRLAALGLSHESNSFAPGRTGLGRMEEAGLLRGDAIAERHLGGTSTVSGFLEARSSEVEVVPLLYTFPVPGPVLDGSAFTRVVDEMVDLLIAGGPWDGVLLGQHGAAIAEGQPDADAAVCRRVREVVGPNVPVGLALDMHANLHAGLIDAVDVAITYRTNPHLDARERALETAYLVARAARAAVRPRQWLERVPVCIGIAAQHTAVDPMAALLRDLDAVLATRGILSASISEGYPYGDVPAMGMAALVVADGDEGLARDAAGWLASRIWAAREEMDPPTVTIPDAVRRAATSTRTPVLLLDSGDNIGGGSGGDSTALVHETIRQGVHPTLVILDDKAAVAACAGLSPGADVELLVGGQVEHHSPPLPVRGALRFLGPGRFTGSGPAHAGLSRLDPGETAVVDTDAGDTVVITSQLIMPTSLDQVLVLGVRPADHRAIIAKGVQSPRPAYGPVCGDVIVVGTPGATTLDLRSLAYQHRARPLWPFEDPTWKVETTWSPD